MTPETRTIILSALERLKGDDLNRAKAAFKHCTPQEMQQEYGLSGKTRQQILDDYQAYDDRIDRAIAEVKAL